MPPERTASSADDDSGRKMKPFRLAPQGTAIKIAPATQEPRRKLSKSERFAVFPRAMLDRIDAQFDRRLGQVAGGVQVYPPSMWRPRYAISTGATHLYPALQAAARRTPVSQVHNYTCISAANVGLLLLLLEMESEFVTSAPFRELDTAVVLERNPSPFALHAFARNELGYHFDKNGCLGICLLREGAGGYNSVLREDDRLHHVPRDFRRVEFFVKADSDSAAAPLEEKEKFLFFLNKKSKLPKKEEANDEDDRVAQLFEKEKKAEKKEWEDNDDDMDFGGLGGFY